jgi:hypothetical protein
MLCPPAFIKRLVLLVILCGLMNVLAAPASATPRCSTVSFAPARNYLVASSGSVTATGDFNGDGYLDIVAGSILLNGSLVVMLNDGTGSFGSPTTYMTQSVHYDVLTADFNNDGKLDIIVSNYFTNDLSVLLGSGDGTFNQPIISSSGGPSPRRIVVSDFNHDGKLDVAVADAPLDTGGNIAILFGNGAGNFALSSTLPKCQFLRGGDFNGDGNMDLLGVTTSPLSLYLGNSQGGFSSAITVGTDLPTGAPSFTLADFDGDGKLDIAALSNSTFLDVYLLRGNGNGTFAAAVRYQAGVQNGAHLAPGDVNGDGKLDIVGTNPDPTMGQGFVLYGTGTGGFSPPAYYYVRGYSPEFLSVADFNGDGRADIVTDLSGAAISVVLTTCLNPTPHYDFDGDGKTDIAVYRPSSGIWYGLRSSDNSFMAQGWGTSTDKIVASDYDGDLKTDLAVYRPSSGTWYILRSSNSTFISQAFGISTDAPVPADYDADGKADLAVYRAGVWYILRSSDNQFIAQSFGTSTDKPVPADYDRDGKADVAIYRAGIWYIQQSSNNQVSAQSFGTSADLPLSGDFDGDGKADVSVYRPQTGTWYALRSSNGSLLAQSWGVSTDMPVPADYDGDGKTDLAVYRPSSGMWFIQRSADNLMAAQPFGLSTDVPVPAANLAP